MGVVHITMNNEQRTKILYGYVSGFVPEEYGAEFFAATKKALDEAEKRGELKENPECTECGRLMQIETWTCYNIEGHESPGTVTKEAK